MGKIHNTPYEPFSPSSSHCQVNKERMLYSEVIIRRGNLSREIPAWMGVCRTQITDASPRAVLQVPVRNGMTLYSQLWFCLFTEQDRKFLEKVTANQLERNSLLL
jgi:hypothetical protein